jgi:hypothetical protein
MLPRNACRPVGVAATQAAGAEGSRLIPIRCHAACCQRSHSARVSPPQPWESWTKLVHDEGDLFANLLPWLAPRKTFAHQNTL